MRGRKSAIRRRLGREGLWGRVFSGSESVTKKRSTPRRGGVNFVRLVFGKIGSVDWSLRSSRYGLIGWGVLGVAVFLSYGLYTSSWLEIIEVKCEMNSGGSCPELIDTHLKRFEGEKVTNFRTSPISETLVSAIPQVREVEYSFTFPGKLDVMIVPAEPMANLVGVDTDTPFFVSDDYRIIAEGLVESNRSTITTHIFQDELRLGGYLSQSTLIFALEIIKSLSEAQVPPSEVVVYGSHERQVIFHDGRIGSVSSHLPLSRQLTSLQVFLATATMSQDYQVIDVRHRRPVLRQRIE